MLFLVQTLVFPTSNNFIIKIYKIIILPVAFYVCEKQYPALCEESELIVLENRILKQIFGPLRNENREWRKLHIGELNSFYFFPIMFRVIKARRLRFN